MLRQYLRAQQPETRYVRRLSQHKPAASETFLDAGVVLV